MSLFHCQFTCSCKQELEKILKINVFKGISVGNCNEVRKYTKKNPIPYSKIIPTHISN